MGRVLDPGPALPARVGLDDGCRSTRPGGGAVAIVAVWLAATVYAFWWFGLKDIRSFDASGYTRAGVFDASGRDAAAEIWFRRTVGDTDSPEAVATVVHVADPSCSCNRFNEPHFASIVGKYAGKGVAFWVLAQPQSMLPGAVAGQIRKIDAKTLAGELDWVKTTPAALIYDHAGHLVYFGPYSTGALCGATEGPVERVLDSIIARERTASQQLLAVGCYCSKEKSI